MPIETTRYRGALPPVVSVQGVHGPAEAPAVVTANRGKAFLVADSGTIDAAWVALGARHGSIGWINTDAYGPPYLFRDTAIGDVVCWAVGGALLRYEEVRRPDPATSENIVERRWVGYRSQPQRALDGTSVFELFDPAGVYDYYATLVGSVLAQLQATNRTLATLRDPLLIPAEYLDLPAASLGVSFDETDTEQIKRNKVASAVAASRIRGTDAAVALRLRQLGVTGYVTECWRAQESAGWATVHGRQPRYQQASVRLKDGQQPAAGQFVRVQVSVEPANTTPMASPVTFTFVSGAAVLPQVDRGANAFEAISNLAAAINAYAGTSAHVRAGIYHDDLPTILLQSSYAYVDGTSPVLHVTASSSAIGVVQASPPANARRRISSEVGWPALHIARRVNDTSLAIRAYRPDGSDLFPFVISAVTPGNAYRRSRGGIVLYNNYVPKADEVIEITSGAQVRKYRYAPTGALGANEVAWPVVPVSADDFTDSHNALDGLKALIDAEFGALSIDTAGSPFLYKQTAGLGESGAPVADPNATWIEVFHGGRSDEPSTHAPTSLVTVHVNNLDGTMLTLPTPPAPGLAVGQSPLPEMDATRAKIVRELSRDILPVNSRIRQWVTDAPMADSVGVGDLLTVKLGSTIISQSS